MTRHELGGEHRHRLAGTSLVHFLPQRPRDHATRLADHLVAVHQVAVVEGGAGVRYRPASAGQRGVAQPPRVDRRYPCRVGAVGVGEAVFPGPSPNVPGGWSGRASAFPGGRATRCTRRRRPRGHRGAGAARSAPTAARRVAAATGTTAARRPRLSAPRPGPPVRPPARSPCAPGPGRAAACSPRPSNANAVISGTVTHNCAAMCRTPPNSRTRSRGWPDRARGTSPVRSNTSRYRPRSSTWLPGASRPAR